MLSLKNELGSLNVSENNIVTLFDNLAGLIIGEVKGIINSLKEMRNGY